MEGRGARTGGTKRPKTMRTEPILEQALALPPASMLGLVIAVGERGRVSEHIASLARLRSNPRLGRYCTCLIDRRMVCGENRESRAERCAARTQQRPRAEATPGSSEIQQLGPPRRARLLHRWSGTGSSAPAPPARGKRFMKSQTSLVVSGTPTLDGSKARALGYGACPTRHRSTPLDTARHGSTPLMILTQQRRTG